jgi:hypothetical protein
MNYFCQLLNVQWVGRITQIKIHTAEPFATGYLKRHKSPGADQIPAELIHAGGETLHSEFHTLIKMIRNKEELPHQWKESIFVPIHKKCNKTE